MVEVYGAGSGLIPDSPVARAEMRAWIQIDETALVPAFYRLVLVREPGARARLAEAYRARLAVLETRLAASNGPFLSGDRPSLADVTVFTHLWRLAIAGPERGLSGAAGPGIERLVQAMRRLPGIDAALARAEEATADLAPYLSGEVRGETRRDMTGQPGAAA